MTLGGDEGVGIEPGGAEQGARRPKSARSLGASQPEKFGRGSTSTGGIGAIEPSRGGSTSRGGSSESAAAPPYRIASADDAGAGGTPPPRMWPIRVN